MNIDGNTQLIGVIADPVSHVRAPQLFNASALKQGLNIASIPLQVAPEQLATFLNGAAALKNLLGMVVTIPHKEAVISLCGELTPAATLVGSANIVRWDRERAHWVGGNFDGDGFVAGLKERGHTLAGKRVLQLGAGGAGKAIAYAVAREKPAEFVLHNRSDARAAEVVARLALALPDVPMRTGPADATGFDVVINATSLGLKDGDALPLSIDTLAPGMLVCEAVMRDTDTALLTAAQARGCLIHQGQYMLYGQLVEMARFFGLPLEPANVARILGPHA